jgi:CubicO group peptidase (beta-lactamase class C family)
MFAPELSRRKGSAHPCSRRFTCGGGRADGTVWRSSSCDSSPEIVGPRQSSSGTVYHVGGPELSTQTKCVYAKSGYLILRLAIERGAGQSYDSFVQEKVFKPMAVSRIVMETAQPIPEETSRYIRVPRGLRPTGRNPVNWLATPTDMVRFLSAVSGTRGEPFLSPRIYRAMVAPPPPPLESRPGAKHVGLGWDAVRNLPSGDQFSKNGGKPGVSAWLEHFPDGVDWAFMINTTSGNKDEPNPAAEIIRRVGKAIEDHSAWPAIDLFRR